LAPVEKWSRAPARVTIASSPKYLL